MEFTLSPIFPLQLGPSEAHTTGASGPSLENPEKVSLGSRAQVSAGSPGGLSGSPSLEIQKRTSVPGRGVTEGKQIVIPLGNSPKLHPSQR